MMLPFALAVSALTIATLAFVLRSLLREHRRVLVITVAAAALLATLLYARLGAVRAVDEDHASNALARPVDELRDDLLAQASRNPRDARAWVLLARLELGEDRFTEAAAAFEKALANPKASTDLNLWCEYADALALAQGRTLVGRPREIVLQTLARNPKHQRALEMAGSAALETGDYAEAALHWRALAVELPEGSSERLELSAALARVELTAADERSRGQLLYETHCIACHTKQIHWRDRRLATDGPSLVAQIERWQRNTGLGWSREEVDDVARYLNRSIYKFAPAKQAG